MPDGQWYTDCKEPSGQVPPCPHQSLGTWIAQPQSLGSAQSTVLQGGPGSVGTETGGWTWCLMRMDGTSVCRGDGRHPPNNNGVSQRFWVAGRRA
jgi:hypothetical protein